MAFEYDEITVYVIHTINTDLGAPLMPDFECYAECSRTHRDGRWEVDALYLDEQKKLPIKYDGNMLERAVWDVIPGVVEADQDAIDEKWAEQYGEAA